MDETAREHGVTRFILALTALAALVGAGACLFIFWPRDRQVTTSNLVPETATRVYEKQVPITLEDGKRGFATIEQQVQTVDYRPVYEARTESPTSLDYLKVGIVAVAAAIIFVFYVAVMAIWIYERAKRKPHDKALNAQLAASTTFLIGLVGGTFVGSPASRQQDSSQVSREAPAPAPVPAPAPSALYPESTGQPVPPMPMKTPTSK